MLPAVLAAMTLAALLVVVPPNATTVSVIGSPGTGAVLPANAAATVEGWWQQQANAQSSETLIESSAVSPATSPPADVPVEATPFDASGIDTQPGFEPNGGRYDQGVDAVLLGSDGRVVIGDGGLTVVRGADEASMTLQFVGADREVEPEFDNTDGPVTNYFIGDDPTRWLTVRGNSSKPGDSVVLADLSSPTTIDFIRQTDTATPPPILIEWSVVEFACGVTVQRGTAFGNASNIVDLAIAPVDPASSFVLGGTIGQNFDVAFEGDDLAIVELVGTDTVRFRTAGPALSTGRQLGFQVIEFDNAGDVAAQVATAALGSGVTANN